MGYSSIAIYGMGRFGRALAGALPEGLLVRTGGRSVAPTGFEADYAQGVAAFLKDLPGSLIVLSVPDDALESVAKEFAALPGARAHDFVHTSGARGAEAIQELADSNLGVFHILQSFPPEGGAELVAGSYVTVAGDQILVDGLVDLAEALQLHVVKQPDPFGRAAYHAAAVLASNSLVALLDIGRELLEQSGIPADESAKMLVPLVRGTLANVQSQGLYEGLTGPVVRGDAGTIERHLGVLKGKPRQAYVAMMLAVADTAEGSGRTPDDKLKRIRDLLNQG